MDNWSLGPPLLVGERIVFRSNGTYLPGTIKWLGVLKNYFGNQLVAGLALVSERLLTLPRQKTLRIHCVYAPINKSHKFCHFHHPKSVFIRI